MKTKSPQKMVAGILGLLIVAGTLVLWQLRSHRSDDLVTVGVILPETGSLAEMGQFERKAMELAASDLKAKGNPLRLIFEDGKGDNKTVAAAANKLLDIDGASVLITSTTGASLTAQPIVEQHQSLQLAFCTSSDVAAKSPNTIRFYIGIEEESKALIQELRNLPRETKVGVLYANVALWASTVSETYEPFLKQQFLAPPTLEQYDLKTKDFRPQLTKLKEDRVSVLIILGYGFEYGPLFSQMVELQLRDSLRIFGGWGFLYSNVPPSVLEGIRVAGPRYVFDRGTNGTDFESRYRAKYGTNPNFDAAFAYEVIMRLPEISGWRVASHPQQLKAALVQHGEFNGVFGKYRFTQDGNMVVETGVGVFRNGVLVGN